MPRRHSEPPSKSDKHMREAERVLRVKTLAAHTRLTAQLLEMEQELTEQRKREEPQPPKPDDFHPWRHRTP